MYYICVVCCPSHFATKDIDTYYRNGVKDGVDSRYFNLNILK